MTLEDLPEELVGEIGDELGRIPARGDVIDHLPLRLEVREMAGYLPGGSGAHLPDLGGRGVSRGRGGRHARGDGT